MSWGIIFNSVFNGIAMIGMIYLCILIYLQHIKNETNILYDTIILFVITFSCFFRAMVDFNNLYDHSETVTVMTIFPVLRNYAIIYVFYRYLQKLKVK
jgi:hypothetical protein